MPFVACEDVGTTPRRSLSAHRRLKAWERTGGVCVVCDLPIDGIRERWIVEHIRALELGGDDDLENMGPAHETCGRVKTRDDNARTWKAKRQKIQHLGVVIPAQPLPGSRGTPFKRKINGRIILREEAAPDLSKAMSCERQPASKNPLHTSPADGYAACKIPRPAGMVNEYRTEQAMASSRSKRDPNTRDAASPPDLAASEILPAVAPHLSFLFEERPLLASERPEPYDALLAAILQEVRPQDTIEALWVKDIVDLTWEATRLRRWRGEILDQARLEAAASLIRPVLESRNAANNAGYVLDFEEPKVDAETQAIALGWLKGEKNYTILLERHLQARGSTISAITARAFQISLSDIQRVDNMIMIAGSRRDALLREIERKRASLGQKLRVASEDILDIDPVSAGEGGSSSPRR